MKIVNRFTKFCISQVVPLSFQRLYSSSPEPLTTLTVITRSRTQGFLADRLLLLPRNRDCLFSNSALHQQQSRQDGELPTSSQAHKKKSSRLPAGKTSLRRVAVEAQRSRDGHQARQIPGLERQLRTKTVTAYCVTERFDLTKVVEILRAEGYEIDPLGTDLYPQVVHVQVPFVGDKGVYPMKSGAMRFGAQVEAGDVFVFPSGTVVTWALPEGIASSLVTKTLLPAAENPHLDELETEHLEYLEEPEREHSNIRGDTIILGTKMQTSSGYERTIPLEHTTERTPHGELSQSANILSSQRVQVETILAKIAFSSGLARSTKLAVLESLLSNYFDSTRSIPTMLSRGTRLPFTRSFILRKTGQLLSVRAQLNLYSELTDSLPDLFWDSRHELGLEGYYDQVGRALDVGVRIKVLNEKMDYAQEIASILRERLSEKHGLFLEWTIIALITVEVGFEILGLWKERNERPRKETHE